MNNIVSIVLIVASAGLFFGYIDPTYSDVKELLAEKAESDNILMRSKELQIERDKLLVKYNAISPENRARLAKLLPDNIDNVRLIIDIDDIARTHGMRIRNFNTTTNDQKDTIGRDGTPYGTLTLSFSTTASYNVFLAFLKDLEHSLRVIDVTAVTFNSGDTSQLYDYNVSVKTYWLK